MSLQKYFKSKEMLNEIIQIVAANQNHTVAEEKQIAGQL